MKNKYSYRRMRQYAKVRFGCILTMVLMAAVMYTYAFGMHIAETNTVKANILASKEFGLIEPFPGKENVVDPTVNVKTVERNITVVIKSVDVETEETTVEATETEAEVKEEIVEEVAVEEIKLFPEEKLGLDVQRHMYNMCKKYDVPMEILMALAFKESSYNPNIVGIDGKDHGLCQIRTINQKWIEERVGRDMDFFNPYDSIEAACIMLSDIRSRNMNKSWEYILLCYNRGEAGARKYVANYGTSSSSYTRDILAKARELGYSM